MIFTSISYDRYSWQLNSIRDDFWKELASAKKEILQLVCDGTLTSSSIARDNAVPHPGVRKLSTEICQDTNTRLVIISGRSSDDLIALLDLYSSPKYGAVMAG